MIRVYWDKGSLDFSEWDENWYLAILNGGVLRMRHYDTGQEIYYKDWYTITTERVKDDQPLAIVKDIT